MIFFFSITDDTASKSVIFKSGFEGVSSHNIFVLGFIASIIFDVFEKSTKLKSKEEVLFLTSSINLYVPPYKSSDAII